MTGWPWEPGTRAAPADEIDIAPGGALTGRVRVPGDKSVSHRALLIAGRADGISVIRGLSDGDDVRRTALAMAAVGAHIDGTPGTEVRIASDPARLHEPEAPLDLGNSGTGMRLIAGWLAAWPWFAVLSGDEYLNRRPMGRVAEPLRQMGARIDGRAGGALPPLAVRGGALHGIDYTLPVPSAQVKGALLFAGLGANGTTTVRETIPVRAHTEEMLAACGADVDVSDDGAVVSVRPSALRPLSLDVPGDPSQAAFWIVAGCIVPGSDLTVEDVYVGRARATFLDVLRRMGADLTVTPRDATTADIRVRHAPLEATVVAGDEVPGLIDEIPVLAVAAACAAGVTEFRDAGELRVKESDRVATTIAALAALGAVAEPRADGLAVRGGALTGGVIDSGGDHRIAMAAAIAGLAARSPSRVRGWASVATSYPAFLDDLAVLNHG